MDGRVVLQDLYETHYGIYNHLTSEHRPLSSVAMYPGEDFNDGSLLESSIRSYMDNEIHEHFKLSLFEYLSNPIDVNAILVKIATEFNNRRNKTMNEIMTNMKNEEK